MCHGFNDWNVMSEHSLRFYEKAKAMGLTAKIYYNQLAHGDPPPFEMMNKWFTHYLHGVENGVEEIANAWIVSEGEYYPDPFKDFPNPAAKENTFYLKKDKTNSGTLSKNKNTSESDEICTFTDNAELSAIELLVDEASTNRLLFLTENLKNDMHISGRGKITIQLSSSQAAANLSVYLVELPKVYDPKSLKMKDIIVTRAWADPQNYKSIENGEALVPGKFYDLTFNFMPDDQVIDKGKQLGLLIFSSDKEFTLQPKKGTILQVNLSNTSIVLPIVEN